MRLRYDKIDDSNYLVYFNYKFIGKLTMLSDGYFYYSDYDSSGYWTSYELKSIAIKLEELNRKHDKDIERYFKKEKLSLWYHITYPFQVLYNFLTDTH